MTDLNKLRSEFESDLADHLIERDANGFYINDEIQNNWEKCLLKAQIKELKAELEKAKAQAVPETHVVVPKLPTPKMIDATWDFDEEILEMSSNTRNEFIWKKMVEASESGAEG